MSSTKNAREFGNSVTVPALEAEIDTHFFRLYALTPPKSSWCKPAQPNKNVP
jgi:hypothetical protein